MVMGVYWDQTLKRKYTINTYKRILLTIFGLVLAIFVVIEMQIMFSGESITAVAGQSPAGTEYTPNTKMGVLSVW